MSLRRVFSKDAAFFKLFKRRPMSHAINRLVEIMATLRTPVTGCPCGFESKISHPSRPIRLKKLMKLLTLSSETT